MTKKNENNNKAMEQEQGIAMESKSEEKKFKHTKKEYFNMLTTIVDMSAAPNKDELKAFITKQIELLDNKKNSTGDRPKDKENAKIKQNILIVLSSATTAMTVTEMLDNDLLKTYKDGNDTARMTAQKLSSLLTQMVNVDKTIVRTELKKKAYFAIKQQ